MWLFYFLFWTAVRASEEPLYGKIGDKAVLTPDSVVNPITSIEWKHGPDLAMEWYGDVTFSYRQFKDRGSMNTLTGALTITGLTPDDSGNYTVEINNKVTSKTQLLVISPVSKPTLSVWCEPEMIYCVLTCNGDTTGAEPVTYWWTSDDIMWPSTKEHKITMKDMEEWFTCAFENPVSFNSSEEVFNPFIRDLTLVYIIVPVVCIIIIIIVIIIIYFIHKRRERSADRIIREILERRSKRTSTIYKVNKTPNQDLKTAESPDTSNETERPASLVAVQETSTQDNTSTGPPETSKETEMLEMLPLKKTSTQDLETAVSPDTMNETEKSPMIPDNLEICRMQDEQTADPEDEAKTEVLWVPFY